VKFHNVTEYNHSTVKLHNVTVYNHSTVKLYNVTEYNHSTVKLHNVTEYNHSTVKLHNVTEYNHSTVKLHNVTECNHSTVNLQTSKHKNDVKSLSWELLIPEFFVNFGNVKLKSFQSFIRYCYFTYFHGRSHFGGSTLDSPVQ
jgi:predicted transcriptional regulator with HTH domain